jgi:hypothetical protein
MLPRHRRRTSTPRQLTPKRKAELKAARKARTEAIAPDGERLFAYETLNLKGIPYTPEHVRRRVAEGTFPRPIYLGPRTPRWRESDIDQWIADLAARSQRAEHGE